jgi:hypothetical protein
MSFPLNAPKILAMAAVVCALILGGCALDSRDRSFLMAHGVGGPLYQKMLHGEPLEIPDIIELSHHGLPPRFIIHYLEDTYFVYNLKTSDVIGLKKAGVSPEVIDYLLATPGLYAPYRGPLYEPYGPYDYSYDYPGPPVYFYPGGHYHRW